MTLPSFKLRSSTVSATTYHFGTEGALSGWAICTVNDRTGELLITSDWGSWSHRWNVRSLGEAATLTAFIGDRSPDGRHYLADKLQQEGRGAREFSPEKTTAALRRVLCERRLEDGREQIAHRWDDEDDEDERGPLPVPMHLVAGGKYDERGLALISHRMPSAYRAGRPWDPSGNPYQPIPYLTRAVAREIWDAIGELANECGGGSGGEALFCERVTQIDGFTEYVTDCPWEHTATVRTHEDRILRDAIIPALIAACATTVHDRTRAK